MARLPRNPSGLPGPDDWLDNPRSRRSRKREKGREKRQVRGAPKASWILMLEGDVPWKMLVEGFGSREEALSRSLQYAKAFATVGMMEGKKIPDSVYRQAMRDSVLEGPYEVTPLNPGYKWSHRAGDKLPKARALKAGEYALTTHPDEAMGLGAHSVFPTSRVNANWEFYPHQEVLEWEEKQRSKRTSRRSRRNPRLTVGQRVKYSDEAINALLERQKWHSGMKAYGAGTVAQRKKRYIQEHRDRRGIITKANPNMTSYIVKWESNPSGDPRDDSLLNVPGHYLVAAKNNPKGRNMTRRFARRNMGMKLPDGTTFDTIDDYMEFIEKTGGGYASPKPKGAKGGKRGKRGKWGELSAEKREEPVTRGQARAIGHYIGGFAEYCPSVEKARQQGARISHLETLSEMGLDTFGQASDIITAMKNAGVGVWYDERTDRSKKKARQILSQHGVSCPI